MLAASFSTVTLRARRARVARSTFCSAAGPRVTLAPTPPCTTLKTLQLDLASFIVGSAPDAEVKLAGTCKQHARFDWKSGRLFVTDLGSADGTLYDGRRLMPEVRYLVGNGAILTFGSPAAEVEVQLEPPPATSPMDAMLLSAFKAKFAQGSAEVQAALRELDAS